MHILFVYFVFFFKQKTAYEMRISDWSSDVCSSDLILAEFAPIAEQTNVPKPQPKTVETKAEPKPEPKPEVKEAKPEPPKPPPAAVTPQPPPPPPTPGPPKTPVEAPKPATLPEPTPTSTYKRHVGNTRGQKGRPRRTP